MNGKMVKAMNKINNQNLEALKVYLGSTQGKKAVKEEKQEKVEAKKEFETKKVEASALDATAAQNKGALLSKIDVSDAATEKRLAEAFANAPFMKALDELQGFEETDFVAFAQKNITGVNHDKLAKYLAKPLHQETVEGTNRFIEMLTA